MFNKDYLRKVLERNGYKVINFDSTWQDFAVQIGILEKLDELLGKKTPIVTDTEVEVEAIKD